MSNVETSVLLVSDGVEHPSPSAQLGLRQALEEMPRYHFRPADSLEALPRLPLDLYHGMVVYIHHTTISPPALKSLEAFVHAGGGLLAVHSASASFKEEPRYRRILGGRFIEHGPIEPFLVQPAAPQDEVFGAVPAFSVDDELYRHEYEPDVRVHFYTSVGQEREPVVWTYHYGRGRVCYCALGHTDGSVRHPRARWILRRGLAWVCGARSSGL